MQNLLEPTIFQIEGHKMKTMYLNEFGLRIMNKQVDSSEEFEKAFRKYKLFYDGKDIPFGKIRSVERNELTNEITIKRKNFFWLISEEFTFIQLPASHHLFLVLEKSCFFSRRNEQKSKFDATKPLWLSLGIFLFFVILAYWNLYSMNSPDFKHSIDPKSRMFEAIVGWFGIGGINGVTLAGLTIFGYLLRKKYMNPPIMTILENPAYVG
jgi:hypothetical protein